VAVDSRYEAAYPDKTVEDAVCVYQTGEWAPFTHEYPTDLVLTQERYGRLEASLAAGGWKPIYRDRGYTLWQAPQGSM
jgi:hypothetical protein